MEIRANTKDVQKLQKVKRAQNLSDVPITTDDKAKVPSISIQNDGKLIEFLRGFKEVKAFLKNGYNQIRRACPIRHRKCIGERCAWYVVKNGTGDCAVTWNVHQNFMIIERQQENQ